jgi:hypothetical protein
VAAGEHPEPAEQQRFAAGTRPDPAHRVARAMIESAEVHEPLA